MTQARKRIAKEGQPSAALLAKRERMALSKAAREKRTKAPPSLAQMKSVIKVGRDTLELLTVSIC